MATEEDRRRRAQAKPLGGSQAEEEPAARLDVESEDPDDLESSRAPVSRESPLPRAIAQPPGNLKATLVRPLDLLVLDFEFVNLKLVGDGDPQSVAGVVPSSSFHLERINPKAPTHIIVSLPGQHVAAEAFLENAPEFGDNTSGQALEVPPVDARIAGLSRLVFQVPSTVFSIPYTTQGLLAACESLPLSVAPQALPPAATAPLRATLVESQPSFRPWEEYCQAYAA
jgi:hypothetical protein